MQMICSNCKANRICDHHNFGFENCHNFIPYDVVQVIRCKDCVRRKEIYERKGKSVDPKPAYYCMLNDCYVSSIDFCSHGKRGDV